VEGGARLKYACYLPRILRIKADADRGFLVESLHEAIEARFAHQQPCLSDEILWQRHNLFAKLKKKPQITQFFLDYLLSLQLI
jgi:hypothetical protein